MKIPARTQYGLRLMFQLAKDYPNNRVQLAEIASRENISEKFLSLIMMPLRSAGLVLSIRGAQGGYRLARDPTSITVLNIFEALEGEVLGFDGSETPIDNATEDSRCAAYEVWLRVQHQMSDAMSDVSLQDLLQIHNSKRGINDFII